MASNVHNFEITRGDALQINLTYRAAGELVDLTGSQVVIAFKWAAGSLVLESPGDVLMGGAAGTIKAVVPGSETEKWPLGTNTAYQVRVIDSLGAAFTLLQGRVSLSRSAIDEAFPDG